MRLIDEFLDDRKKMDEVADGWENQQRRPGEKAEFLITDDGGLEIGDNWGGITLTRKDTKILHRFLREWFDPESSARQRRE